jgi:DNA mismatch repair protein MutL
MEALAAHISETGKAGFNSGKSEWKDDIFAFLACRAAVKANRVLADPEIIALCRDLDAIPFASNCPHGRPVFIRFSHKEIEKMFRRS